MTRTRTRSKHTPIPSIYIYIQCLYLVSVAVRDELNAQNYEFLLFHSRLFGNCEFHQYISSTKNTCTFHLNEYFHSSRLVVQMSLHYQTFE